MHSLMRHLPHQPHLAYHTDKVLTKYWITAPSSNELSCKALNIQLDRHLKSFSWICYIGCKHPLPCSCYGDIQRLVISLIVLRDSRGRFSCQSCSTVDCSRRISAGCIDVKRDYYIRRPTVPSLTVCTHTLILALALLNVASRDQFLQLGHQN